MPVKPASAKAAIKTFRAPRTAISVVAMDMASRWGWLIWTPMNMTPAATADAAAIRMTEEGVTVMVTFPAAGR